MYSLFPHQYSIFKIQNKTYQTLVYYTSIEIKNQKLGKYIVHNPIEL
jgi:hypothetical protein